MKKVFFRQRGSGVCSFYSKLTRQMDNKNNNNNNEQHQQCSSCKSNINNNDFNRVLCLDCNQYVYSIDDITDLHFKHNIFSNASLDTYLRKENIIDSRFKDLMKQLRENAETTYSLQQQVGKITSVFKDIYEQLRLEEYKLRKPIEDEIEKSMESLKTMYNEIIHYWRINKWMNNNNDSNNNNKNNDNQTTNNNNSNSSKDGDNNENEELEILDSSIEYSTKGDILKLTDNSVYTTVSVNSDEPIYVPIINFKSGDITSKMKDKRPDPFNLMEEMRSHQEIYQKSKYLKAKPVEPIMNNKIKCFKDGINKFVEQVLNSKITVEIKVPTKNEPNSYSDTFVLLDNTWKLQISKNFNKDSNKWISVFLCLADYVKPVNVEFQLEIGSKSHLLNYCYKESIGFGLTDFMAIQDFYKSVTEKNTIMVTATINTYEIEKDQVLLEDLEEE
ncbi:hypothetical protein PPL_00593 [Heterostelium album PN500]|uniref:MATH domain-containing protein n=1 Tax=Heterostelium pallidum (strain ATCC 26659 / Pp 5 / PN500) TaxID=670386 RepID=D3AWW5_HETP5|nr:hypothetical protein PPL_00593 [Heterostelium album PN500]EFA86788.1 hypothetical protein PPL_00593 [Heterostelium album PN500]|eukprot:XP_020438892.1 hypothetical protein PPL_00593 [Heterostelium album PN500]